MHLKRDSFSPFKTALNTKLNKMTGICIKKQLKEWNDKIKIVIIKSKFELYDKYKF